MRRIRISKGRSGYLATVFTDNGRADLDSDADSILMEMAKVINRMGYNNPINWIINGVRFHTELHRVLSNIKVSTRPLYLEEYQAILDFAEQGNDEWVDQHGKVLTNAEFLYVIAATLLGAKTPFNCQPVNNGQATHLSFTSPAGAGKSAV